MYLPIVHALVCTLVGFPLILGVANIESAFFIENSSNGFLGVVLFNLGIFWINFIINKNW